MHAERYFEDDDLGDALIAGDESPRTTRVDASLP